VYDLTFANTSTSFPSSLPFTPSAFLPFLPFLLSSCLSCLPDILILMLALCASRLHETMRIYVRRIEAWKRAGYRIENRLPASAFSRTSARRIEVWVRQSAQEVPKRDVLRRFKRGWENFEKTYRPMAESWAVYDNSGTSVQLMERKE